MVELVRDQAGGIWGCARLTFSWKSFQARAASHLQHLKKKKEVNLKQRIEKLRKSVFFLQEQIDDLKKDKVEQDERLTGQIAEVKQKCELNEKHLISYKQYVPPTKKGWLDEPPQLDALQTPMLENSDSGESDQEWDCLPGDAQEEE